MTYSAIHTHTHTYKYTYTHTHAHTHNVYRNSESIKKEDNAMIFGER